MNTRPGLAHSFFVKLFRVSISLSKTTRVGLVNLYSDSFIPYTSVKFVVSLAD